MSTAITWWVQRKETKREMKRNEKRNRMNGPIWSLRVVFGQASLVLVGLSTRPPVHPSAQAPTYPLIKENDLDMFIYLFKENETAAERK